MLQKTFKDVFKKIHLKWLLFLINLYYFFHEYIYLFLFKYEWDSFPLFIFTESVYHSFVIVCVQINKAQHCYSPPE